MIGMHNAAIFSRGQPSVMRLRTKYKAIVTAKEMNVTMQDYMVLNRSEANKCP